MKTTTKRILQVLLFCLLAAVLSLGTAIATSAAEITSGSLDTSKTYTIGAENSGYTLVYSGGWKVQRTSDNKYYKYDFSWQWNDNGDVFNLQSIDAGGATLYTTVSDRTGSKTQYLTYNTNTGINCSNNSAKVKIFGEVSESGTTPSSEPQQTTSKNTVTFYFTNNKSWSSVYAYVWKDGGTAEVAWPGKALETHTKNSYEQDIYSVTIDLDQYDRVIFNNGSDSAKTEDIDVDAALQNGSGIYIDDSDTTNPYSVKYYNHNIDFSKTIEKLSGEGHGDYDYRLHLNVMGEHLAGTTTTEEHTGKSTGIVLLIDVTKDFTATTSDNKSKMEVIQNIVNNYINQFAVSDRNKISVILVRGEQYGSINSTGTVETVKAWNENKTISLSNEQIRYTANFKAGLVQATNFIQTAGTDQTAVVFITNSNPQFSVKDDGSVLPRDKEINDEGPAKTDILNYLPTFLDNNPETDLYILDVEQASEKHETPIAMGEYLESVNRGQYTSAGSSQEIIDSFDEIITTIIPGDKTKDLTVVDTLSDKVAFLGNNKQEIIYSAKIWLGSKTGEGTDVSSYVSVNTENKTVTFSGYDTIDGIFYLEIAFNIKTADDVFHESTGYPNTGDEGTDYGDNTTSSGKLGYFSNVKESSTVSYTLNSEPTRTAEFKQPVVQAPEPQDGVYKFTYPDRNETIYYGKDNPGDNGYFAYKMYTKTVTRRLKSAEIRGYSGNGNQAGVPTYLWTDEAQALFEFNPLLTASFEVQGNLDDEYKNVSFYKHDIQWPTMEITVLPADDSIKVVDKDVVVTAEAPEKTFTFKYVTEQNGTPVEGAEKVKYAENVTFNPAYKGQEGIHVIEGVTLPENLTYWSSDAAGKSILTTVKTFGMLIRGGYTAEDLDKNVVTVYAQTKAPEGEAFQPFIEEATLTRVIADDGVNRYYADYMVDYLNINGDVVQDMIDEGQNVSYGLAVLVYDTAKAQNITQEKMETVAKTMSEKSYKSASIGTGIAYRYEYTKDKTRISDYNRTLYTLNGNYENLKGKTLTAIAYIVVTDADTQEKKYYYTPINQQIVVNP